MRTGRQWPLRLVGSLFGIGACAIGLFSLFGMEGQPDLNRERAIGFGIAALAVGAVALAGSLASRDVRALWYCSPRRWRAFRGDVMAGAPKDRPAPRSLTSADGAAAAPRSARKYGRW